MFTLLEMAAKLAAVGIETELACDIALVKAAVIVQTNARDAIGNPDNGYGWPPLAESTLERKGADTPLLETGELKNSIGITLGHRVAYVGSNLDRAVYHEFGTDKIPPRPFIGPAAIESEEVIHQIAVKTVGRALAGHSAGTLVEVLHAIKEGAEYVNEKMDEAEGRRK